MKRTILECLKQRLNLLAQAKVLDWFWTLFIYNSLNLIGVMIGWLIIPRLIDNYEPFSIHLIMNLLAGIWFIFFFIEGIILVYTILIMAVSFAAFFIHRYLGFLTQVVLVIGHSFAASVATNTLVVALNTAIHPFSWKMQALYSLWYIFILYRVSARVAKQSMLTNALDT